ncbi:AT-rich interactive domain-containing protein 5A isoform X1 [Vombatus ursinus]|uniref:AT-rich interaction domain 5A n=2 Tax=Vombatus ursinus TaxID=29139 RepID=A0A4X2L807_VOMUR|nr:AT-rich interactive domain-containing protein 5A isoform X1 [Vombatus ursinus]
MAPPLKGKRKRSEGSDPLDQPTSPKPDSEESQSSTEPVESPEAGGEREQEQAFLVSLYKFMKERHTPIERVPHLGFKQINLWKIYKAVEKLGAYELVTGRRLWKNVYDELGGSPGSTSAATCTRRHYERLVLPYVRHLKGEDDKPLPPTKPRKQYKVSKEPKGDEAVVEKPKKAKEERNGGQIIADKTKPETTSSTRLPGQEEPESSTRPPGPSLGMATLPFPGGPEAAGGCAEAYKRLLSSFYCKGTHGIMSPLAKKKLLAQVSKAEALQCHDEACDHRLSGSEAGPTRPSVIYPTEGPKSPGLQEESPREPPSLLHRLASPEEPLKTAHSPKEDVQPGGNDRGPAQPHLSTPIFTGCFHAYPAEVLKPVSRHPHDFFPSSKDEAEAGSPFRPPGKEGGKLESQPQLLWGGDASHPSAFHKGGAGKNSPYPRPKACWVPPMAKATPKGPSTPPTFPSSPSPGSGSGSRNKRSLEEESFALGKKLRAVSPFLKEVEPKDSGVKPSGPNLGFPHLLGPTLGPPPQEAYKGTMVRFPLNFANMSDPLKGQASLPFSPLVIPAFPAHFLTTSTPSPMAAGLVHYPPTSFEGSLRHRLYPVSTWHMQPTYQAPHLSSFHLNTKL